MCRSSGHEESDATAAGNKLAIAAGLRVPSLSREIDEFDSGHIPGAVHCYVGYLADKLNELPLDKTRPVVVTCGVGHRAGVGVSILLRAGFKDVSNLIGGMKAWHKLDFPIE